jgi:tetratricopeptide (TPR) repeat protein
MQTDDYRFTKAGDYWERGEIDKALAVFNDIIKDEALPASARAIVCEYVGRLQIGIWKLPSAEKYLRRAIELNPEGVEHHVQLVNCLCLQGRQDEAWKMIRRLYRQYPDHASAVHYMGKMLDERGRHQEGLELMKKSIRMEPNNERFLADLSFTYLMRGNPGAAMVCSEQAMTLNPKDDVVQFVHKVVSEFEIQEETSGEPIVVKSGPQKPKRRKKKPDLF